MCPGSPGVFLPVPRKYRVARDGTVQLCTARSAPGTELNCCTRASAAVAPWRRLPDWTRASALTRPCLPRLLSLRAAAVV